jgi:hypothetical protein
VRPLSAGYSAPAAGAVSETLPGTDTPVFTTFMDPPATSDFSQAIIDNSVTMDLLNKAHLWFRQKSIIHASLDIDLYRELFSFVECGGFYSGNAFLVWFRQKLRQAPRSISLEEIRRETHSDVPW